MKISEYILELLTNEHEANMLENEQNFYGADVCLMRGVGYDRAMAEVSRLAVNEQDI